MKPLLGSVSAVALLALCSCSSTDDSAPDRLTDDDTIIEEGYATSTAKPVAPEAPAPAETSPVAATPPPAPAPHTPAAATTNGVYTARPGDTLSGIAALHHLSTERLRAANGMSPAAPLLAGQKLCIPTGGAVNTSAKPTLAVKTTAKPSVAAPKATRPSSYTVQRGDTISKIAAKTGVSSADIIRANNINRSNINLIQVGSKLTIPAKK